MPHPLFQNILCYVRSPIASGLTCDILRLFGFPSTIITDLGSNFTSHEFWEFCERSAIEVKYVLMAHPQANSQVEHANSLILDELKKRLRC
jgi:hypothetical protein